MSSLRNTLCTALYMYFAILDEAERPQKLNAAIISGYPSFSEGLFSSPLKAYPSLCVAIRAQENSTGTKDASSHLAANA
jgi:hypothetical protein